MATTAPASAVPSTEGWLGVTRNNLAQTVVAGAIVGLLLLVTSISYPAVIFSGELAPYAPIGVRMGLFAGAL